MITPFAEEYKSPKYHNPGDNIDPKDKNNNSDVGREWFLRKAQFIYSSYLRNDCYITAMQASDIYINRLYGQGMQPIAKYQERLSLNDKNTTVRKGTMNVSWDICPIIPKYRSLLSGKFEDIDYAINVLAIDNYSSSEREDEKKNVLVKSKYKQQLAPFKQSIGIEDEAEQLPFEPQTMEEVNMLSGMGFFKLPQEIEMDGLIISTSQKCNWTEIKRRIIEDLIDAGFAATKDYTDPVSHKPMVRYVDVANLLIRQTRLNDFSNVSEAAEVCWYSVADLRSFGLPEEEIRKAATRYNGQWGNSNAFWGTWNNNLNQYDDFKIAVLDAEFSSFDTFFYESVTKKNGNVVNYDIPFKENISDAYAKKGAKLTVKKYQKLYRCKWIIGTDILFDYGYQFDVPYDQEGKPKSSFTCYRVANRSMINQLIAVADDIQLAILRLRNALAEAPPAGIQVEWGSLEGMSLGGQKLTPMDILKIRRRTGDLLFKYSISENGLPIQGGIPPITELEGGIGRQLTEFLSLLDFNIKLIQDITGINALSDASTPPTHTLVGVAEIAQSSTNNVIKPILSAYKSIKQRTFNNLVTRWQLANYFYGVRNDTIRSDGAVENINISTDLYQLEFEAYCDLYISDHEKAELTQACLASMQAAKTGSIGIQLSDYIYIKQLMARNNIRAARVYLSYREQQMAALQQMTADRNQQLNNQSAQAMAQIEADQRMREIIAAETEKRKTMSLEYIYKKDIESMKLRAEKQMAAKDTATKEA